MGHRRATAGPGERLALNRLHEFEGALREEPDRVRRTSVMGALRYQHGLLQDRLKADLLAIAIGAGANDGSLLRGSLKYLVRDDASIEVGGILFGSGDRRPFSAFERNDRLFLRLALNF